MARKRQLISPIPNLPFESPISLTDVRQRGYSLVDPLKERPPKPQERLQAMRRIQNQAKAQEQPSQERFSEQALKAVDTFRNARRGDELTDYRIASLYEKYGDRLLSEVERSPSRGQQDSVNRITANASPSAKQAIPKIITALEKEGITDKRALAYALATVEHETGGTFQPLEEFGGRDQARRRGYSGGDDFFGRGYIQLTHDYNYRNYGQRIGLGDKLLQNPNLAKDPEVAARILAAYFKDRGIDKALAQGNLVAARRMVNGGILGLQKVNDAYQRYLKSL